MSADLSAATPPLLPPTPTPGPTPPTPAVANPLLDEPPPRAWWQRWPLWLGLALALAAAGGGTAWWRQRQAAAAPVYITEPATVGDVVLTVTANGTLQPTRAISIGSELSGTVLQVKVDVNDRITRGQVLVVLDTAKLRDQISRTEALLAAAQAKVAQQAATVAEARAALARLDEVSRLSGGQVPSRAELDSGRATLARALADGASAAAGVQDATAALSTDRINLSKASIRAPSDGVVLTRNVDPGNAVAASLQAVTLFSVAEDLHHLTLWVYVDEADVGAVQPGQAASFTVSAWLKRQFPARITRVGLGSTITDNVVTYLTTLAVDNADLSLRPGMTATATITATRHASVLRVPNTALRFNPAAAGGGGAGGSAAPAKPSISLMPRIPGANRKSAAAGASTAGARQVWVLPDGDGAVPVAVAVTPGISDGHLTEVSGTTLQAGQRVITDQKAAAK